MTLSPGSKGVEVERLQKTLNDVGFALKVDGAYGPLTESAVRTFQKARGIAVDGIAGPDTLQQIGQAMDEGWTIASATPSVPAPSHEPAPAVPPRTGPGPTPPPKESFLPFGLETINPFVLVGGGLVLIGLAALAVKRKKR